MGADDDQVPVGDVESLLAIRYGWWKVPMWQPLVADIARQAAKESLRPIAFRRILKKHVSEVLAIIEARSNLAEHQNLVEGLRAVIAFTNGRKLSWTDFHEQGCSLSRVSGLASPDLLVSLGQLMGLARTINVMFGHAEEPIVPCFCSMCWRFVLGGEKYCRTHRVPVGGSGGQKRQDSDSYWFGRRLASQFCAHIRRLASQARKEKLRSQWVQAIKTGQVDVWLQRYRPLAWSFIAARETKLCGASVVPAIIQTLDEHKLEAGVQREQRRIFHRSLLHDRTAIFDLLLRAEAWLAASAERRSCWGGSRVGAGRHVSTVSKALCSDG